MLETPVTEQLVTLKEYVSHVAALTTVSLGAFHYRRLVLESPGCFRRRAKLVEAAEAFATGLVILPAVSIGTLCLWVIEQGLKPDAMVPAETMVRLVGLFLAAMGSAIGYGVTVHLVGYVHQLDALLAAIDNQGQIPAELVRPFPEWKRFGALTILIGCLFFVAWLHSNAYSTGFPVFLRGLLQ